MIGLCAESHCTFHAALEFPEVVRAGLRVGHLGTSSVRYELGIFREGGDEPAATGWFVARLRRPRDPAAGGHPGRRPCLARAAARRGGRRVRVAGRCCGRWASRAPTRSRARWRSPSSSSTRRARRALVRVRAAGLCHSDLSVIDGSRPRVMPMVLGHEAAGEVVGTGEGVDAFAPGDHVVALVRAHLRRVPGVPGRHRVALRGRRRRQRRGRAAGRGQPVPRRRGWRAAPTTSGSPPSTDHVVVSEHSAVRVPRRPAVRDRRAVRLRRPDRRGGRAQQRPRRAGARGRDLRALAASASRRCSAPWSRGRGRSWPSTSCPPSSSWPGARRDRRGGGGARSGRGDPAADGGRRPSRDRDGGQRRRAGAGLRRDAARRDVRDGRPAAPGSHVTIPRGEPRHRSAR